MGNLDGLGYRDTTCVVTGGASGMGEQVARILGELGARVHIVDIQPPKVANAGFHSCDLSDFAAVRATAAALQAIAPIDFLFPCAGLPPHIKGPLYCMQVNYIGARLFIESLLPALKDGAGIALISSDAALGWQKNLAQSMEMLAIADPDAALAWVEADPDKRLRDGYTTSKEMLAVWVQHAAVELGLQRRIRLNATAPAPPAPPSWTARRSCCPMDSWKPGPIRRLAGWRPRRNRPGRWCCSTARLTPRSPGRSSTPTRASPAASSPAPSTPAS